MLTFLKKIFVRQFRFQLMNYEWGRKWMKGTFYYIEPRGLPMAPFWSDVVITSCQSVVVDVREYK